MALRVKPPLSASLLNTGVSLHVGKTPSVLLNNADDVETRLSEIRSFTVQESSAMGKL